MRIVDLITQGEISDTQIGQKLQLIIEMKPRNGKQENMSENHNKILQMYFLDKYDIWI